MSDLHHNPAEIVRGLLQHGWGHAQFELTPDGDLREVCTVITVKPMPNESVEHFMERVRTMQGLQFGDQIVFISSGGRMDIAKITKAPRC